MPEAGVPVLELQEVAVGVIPLDPQGSICEFLVGQERFCDFSIVIDVVPTGNRVNRRVCRIRGRIKVGLDIGQ